MLSVLIPTYNVNVHPLVSELQTQLAGRQIDYEIIIADDASTDTAMQYHNAQLEKQDNVRYIQHETNLGRSKTRNELADAAQYPFLLFLDCDARVKRNTYIADYLNFIESRHLEGTAFAVSGGLSYREGIPPIDKRLRYRYGTRREMRPIAARNLHPYHNFTPFNLLMSKSVFETCRFDESLTGYGYEDTFFGMALEDAGIPVYHIANEMFHDSLDDNKTFIAKIANSVRNLDKLYRDGKVDDRFLAQSRLLQTWQRLRSRRAASILFGMLRLSRPLLFWLMCNLNSLKAMDLYKLVLFDELQR